MMPGGLLHSIPIIIDAENPTLLKNIEDCVDPSDGQKRYNIVLNLILTLENILYDKDNY